jgi:hypothetical protein
MDPELEVRHNLFIQSKSKKVKEDFYTEGQALLIAHLMVEMDYKAANVGGAAHFAQQYILQKGLKKFGQKGSDAAELVHKDRSKMAYRVGHLEKCIV